MMNKTISMLCLMFGLIVFFSCGSSDEDGNKYVTNANCTSVPAENTYTKTIKPVLDASCAFAGCHDSQTKAEGVILDTYAGAKATFAASAKGLCSINHDGCADNMPQGSAKLSQDVLNLFACWVKNNMPQ